MTILPALLRHASPPVSVPSKNRGGVRVIYLLGTIAAGAALLGFLTGLFSFKVKSRWCPECGATTLPERPVNQEKAS
jgi:hypothetical protein